MKVLIPMLCLFLLAGCGLEELSEICDETPDTTYLVSVRNVNYAQIGATHLNDPVNHQVDICIDHFPANTPAGHQYNAAVDEINRQEGSELHFTTKRTGVTHKDPFDLVPNAPTASIFDYIDISEPMPNACSLPGDLTFAMRACKHDQSGGGTDHFTIMAKSTNYGHFSDPTSDDYPKTHGILHELAHAFGMIHTPNWDANDKKYISTMQGNLEYLSALDVDYLRHNYPDATPDHRNYVASSLTRFNETKAIFENQNPDAFFVNGDGYLKDCATNGDPTFYAAWFNTGSIDGESEICGINKIFLREKSVSAKTIELKTWKIATMPFLSQDQWQGRVSVLIEDASTIDFSREWELVFKVNALGTLDETTTEDNEITMDIELGDGSC